MKEDYIERINKVLIFIDDNLDNELSLEAISKVACYSPFHLHRLFKAITNETLNGYITRKRIEKTAILLVRRMDISVTELSMRYGFNGNSSFTRTFKKFYGVSPSRFRNLSVDNFSKIGTEESKNGQEKRYIEEYICNINNHKNRMDMNAKIEITEMPELNLAFVTHIGEKGVDHAVTKLIQWAGPKGLLEKNDFKIVRIYHDSFKITDADKIRMSICVILKEPVSVGGEIGLTSIEKGKWIVGHFEIEPIDFGKSWRSLFIWMAENGYQKADRNPFEIIHNDFNQHPEKKCIVDLYIPIINN
jgi:AraC family transcriptional regulator